MLPEGLTPDEHWAQSHAYLRKFGHPFEAKAVLPVDTRGAAKLPKATFVAGARDSTQKALSSASASLQPLSQALEDLMSNRIRRVAAGRNLGIWVIVMVLLEWPDVSSMLKMVLRILSEVEKLE